MWHFHHENCKLIFWKTVGILLSSHLLNMQRLQCDGEILHNKAICKPLQHFNRYLRDVIFHDTTLLSVRECCWWDTCNNTLPTPLSSPLPQPIFIFYLPRYMLVNLMYYHNADTKYKYFVIEFEYQNEKNWNMTIYLRE